MRRQNILLIILLLSLGIGTYFFFSSTDNHLSSIEARDFGIKNIELIDKIFLSGKNGSQTVLTKETDIWRINGNYVARNLRIQTLLKTAEKIKVKQRVPKAKKERIIKNLATSNIKAEFYAGDKLIKSYFVGSADGLTTGTYMLLINEESGENHSTPFLTHLPGFEGYLTPRYEPNPSTWRDLKIFYFPKNAIKSVSLNYPENPENNFEIKLQKNKYILFQKNKAIKSNELSIKKYLLNFKSIAAESLIPNPFKDSIQNRLKNQKPWFTLSVKNLLDKTTIIKGYKKDLPVGSTNSIGVPIFYDPDRFYGICFNNELGSLQHYVFEPLLTVKSKLE